MATTAIRGRARWRLLAGGLVAALLAAEVAVAVPSFSAALTRLQRADPFWVALAVAAEAASMGCFAYARRRLMAAAGVRVGQRDTLAAVYVANAVHMTVPGGAAFSTAWVYRWMRARGASAPVITWTLVAGGVLSTTTLAALGVTGSLLAGRGTGAEGLLADGLAVGLLVAGVWLARHPGSAAAVVDRLPRRVSGRPARAVRDLLEQVGAVRPRVVDWLAAALGALATWVLDAACLAAGATALGVHLSLPVLLLGYTAGMAASGLSVLPAGLGVVDGAMVLVLTAGGLPAATALPVVLLYRLISLVGVVAAGWAVAAVQAVTGPRSAPSGAEPLTRGSSPAAAGSIPGA